MGIFIRLRAHRTKSSFDTFLIQKTEEPMELMKKCAEKAVFIGLGSVTTFILFSSGSGCEI